MISIPRIAVLLAAYNGEKWIEKQIETILNQKDVDLHLYISIDISTDSTYKIVCKLSQKRPEIIILPYGRRFGGAAPNFYHLLLMAPLENYEYVALSDQDDIWLDNKLIRGIKVLETQHASGYSSNVITFWGNEKKKIIRKDYPQTKYDYLFEAPGGGNTFVLESQLASAICDSLKSYSWIDALHWHDWLIYAYARKNGYRWVIDSSRYILYRQHDNNLLGTNSGIKAFLNRVKRVINGYAINQSIGIVKFLQLENDPFVLTWLQNNKIHYMALAMQSNKCRRRKRDRIFFFFACFIMSIIRPKITNKCEL